MFQQSQSSHSPLRPPTNNRLQDPSPGQCHCTQTDTAGGIECGYNISGHQPLKRGSTPPTHTTGWWRGGSATYRGRENIMGTTSDQEALTYFSVRELERVLVFTWKRRTTGLVPNPYYGGQKMLAQQGGEALAEKIDSSTHRCGQFPSTGRAWPASGPWPSSCTDFRGQETRWRPGNEFFTAKHGLICW